MKAGTAMLKGGVEGCRDGGNVRTTPTGFRGIKREQGPSKMMRSSAQRGEKK